MPDQSITQPRPDIVAIGASAGGVEAIRRLLRQLPGTLPAAVLIGLHRSPAAPSYLVEVLGLKTALTVRVARDGMSLEQGVCLVSPPAHYLSISAALHVHLIPDGFYRGHSIDLLFNSLARCAGPRTIGVVLTGMLRDGSLGLKAIKEAGGIVLVQDPSDASFSDMPQNAIRYDGPVDYVGSIDALAAEICARLNCGALDAAGNCGS